MGFWFPSNKPLNEVEIGTSKSKVFTKCFWHFQDEWTRFWHVCKYNDITVFGN